MPNKCLRIDRLCKNDIDQLSLLFEIIANDSSAVNFHPHPFTKEQAIIISSYQDMDIYLGAFVDDELSGYGMLRGWDSGFQIPSLGIYLSPSARGRGFAGIFMSELHHYAHENGAHRVRLKVYPSNAAALIIYKRMGYTFETEEEGQLVGYINLHS